ncbi:MAG: DoxX family protein [Planctomycetota bacterium]
MQLAFEVSILISALAFLGYGAACLFTQSMIAEFERFGLARFRSTVGVREILGGAGLLVGLYFQPILLVASGGLTALMALGVATRLRVGDSALLTAPAALFLALNGFVFWTALQGAAPGAYIG